MSLTSCEGALDDILGEWSRPTPGSSTGGAVAVTSIDLDADEMKLTVGDKGQLTAKVDPAGTAVTWSSDKVEIATVEANGMVTAVAVGTAIITAKAGDKTATCEVTVLPTLSTPLTLEVTTAGTIIVGNPQAGMQYSLNDGAKTAVPDGTAINGGNLNVGDKVAFYGSGTSISKYYGTFIEGGTADVKVYGNIMSLVDEDGFASNTVLPNNNVFFYLFKGNTKLIDASGLLLPALTLTNYCYNGMFSGCSSLTTAPAELPATTLAQRCYYEMFRDCTNLTTAPKLPATNLANDCYYRMFYGCASLTTAPKLPATTLAQSCYYEMFRDCTNLTTAPKLPATNLANSCYIKMFYQCSSLTTAYVKAPYNTYFDNMFFGCTAVGAVLHTTSTNQGSWNTAISDNNWSTWTADDGWTD